MSEEIKFITAKCKWPDYIINEDIFIKTQNSARCKDISKLWK
jgi:hypothetical protein